MLRKLKLTLLSFLNIFKALTSERYSLRQIKQEFSRCALGDPKVLGSSSGFYKRKMLIPWREGGGAERGRGTITFICWGTSKILFLKMSTTTNKVWKLLFQKTYQSLMAQKVCDPKSYINTNTLHLILLLESKPSCFSWLTKTSCLYNKEKSLLLLFTRKVMLSPQIDPLSLIHFLLIREERTNILSKLSKNPTQMKVKEKRSINTKGHRAYEQRPHQDMF